MRPEAYDHIVVNSSAGKDSQAMLDYVHEWAGDYRSRLIVAHSDLGKAEWPGCRELAEEQAKHYGIRFMVVKRPQGDLLDHVRQRRMWPSSIARYCTSDHKRGQIQKIITAITRESGRYVRILNCLGMRSQESPARSKLKPFQEKTLGTNGKRQVDTWLPIHHWTVDEVWKRIRASGVPHHFAYDLGMPRLSCCFCIFAPRSALLLAGKHNRELLDEYVAIEKEIGHKFRVNLPILEIAQELDRGVDPGKVEDWNM